MASSMTIPVARDSASSVMLFNVIPIAFMTANVPISDTGIATAAMMVLEISQKEKHDDRGKDASQY
jgi:hypothetical protein